MWKKRLAVAGLLLTVLLFILIQTASFQQWLLRRIQNLGAGAGFPFKADKLRLNLFQLRASLDGFVYDKDGTKVRIDHATIDMPWNAFFGRDIVVNTLLADGVTINIQSPEPVIPEPTPQKTSMPRFQIARLGIHNVNLTYTNQTMLVRVPAFTLDAVNGRGRIRIAAPVTISPDTQIALQEVPILLGPDSLQFGPLDWSLQYAGHDGKGGADGDLKWSPSVAFHLNFTAQPLTIEKWKDLLASGQASYEDGILKMKDIRVLQGGAGQLTAAAEISDRKKTATLIWSALRLDPAGIPGTTGGSLNLNWKASDFSDSAGEGAIDIASPRYGRVHSNIRVHQGKASLDIAANAMDADIRANIVAGIDHTLSGSFRATQHKYGLIKLNGKLAGTFENPAGDAFLVVRNASYDGIGPLNASAKAAIRGRLVTVNELRAQLGHSTMPGGSLRVNLDSRQLAGAIPRIDLDVHDFSPDAQGQATLSATIGGTIDRPRAAVTGLSNGIDIGGTHIDSVRLDGRFANNTLVLNRLEAKQADGSLMATGSLNTTTRRLAADAHVTNFLLVHVRDLSAAVNLDAAITGTTGSPEADIKGELRNIVYRGQEHGDIALEGATRNKVASIHAISTKYTATVGGEVRMLPPYRFDATLTANQSHVQHDKYDIVADGKAHATGQAQPFEARNVSFENFKVKGNGIDLTADGSMDTGAKIHATANLAQLPVDNATMTGDAAVDGVVSGTLTDPVVEGRLVTDNATVQTQQMSEPAAIRAEVDFDRNAFTIRQMHATVSDAAARIEGRGTLKGTGEFTFSATHIRPEQFMKDRPLSGVVSLEGRVKLDAPRLDAVNGEAHVTELDLSLRDIPIHQVRPIDVSIQNQKLVIRDFEVEGADTHATASGIVDLRSKVLNLNVEGNTDLQIIEALVPDSYAKGKIDTRLAVRGTMDHPDLDGFVMLTDTEVQTANPPLQISSVEADIRFGGDRLEIVRAQGNLNEGRFQATGGSGLSAEGLKNASVHLTLDKAQLEYPEGLQSELSTDMQLSGSSPRLELEGIVDINNALYRKEIDLSQEIFSRIVAEHNRPAFAGPRKPPAFAEQVQLNIEVRNSGLVSVVNNMANLDLTGNFRVRGSAADPVILGRAAVLEGGEVYFGPGVAVSNTTPGERRDRYVIERGEVVFNNATRTEPTVDLEATHEVNSRLKGERVLVTLRATGTPSNLRTELTSDPYLEQPDIIAMLLTGRTTTELMGSQLAAGEEQLAAYLSGRVSGFFDKGGAALGLDTVTIEPVAVANTSDLGARLTLGKDFSTRFRLAFSQSLAGPQDQTLIAEYSWIKNLLFRAIRSTENKEARLEFKHDLKFGGGPPLPKRIEPKNESALGDVTFAGANLPEKELRKRVTKQGKPFNAYRMREDIRDLEDFLASKDFLKARIRTERDAVDGHINLHFEIDPGPVITFAYEGLTIPAKTRNDIRHVWASSFSEAIALGESTKAVLQFARDKGYLKAKVSTRDESTSEENRRFVYIVEPGPKFKDPEWLFKGAEPIEIPQSPGTVMAKPEMIRQHIEYRLRKQGYLDAKATAPELIFEEDRPRFVVTVDEGRQYMVERIDFEGNRFMDEKRLSRAIRLGPSNPARPDEAGRPPEVDEPLPDFPFTEDWVEKSQQRAITEYWQEGFNDVQVKPATTTDRAQGKVRVHFSVVEGERQMIESVRIDGAELTGMGYVLRQFQFTEGDPVDYTRINLTRKKLYDTRVFKRVEIEIVKNPSTGGYIAQVHLNEQAPWRFRYGFAAGNHSGTRDRDLGMTTDFSYGNLFGKAILAGLSFKNTASEKDGRIYGTMPSFFGRDNVRSTLTLFKTRDLTIPGAGGDRWGYTAQQQWRLKNFYILTYDYGYRWEHLWDRDLTDGNLVREVTIPIARFNGTLSRDTRDDILNATRGTFVSSSLEVAPPRVGSAIRFARSYTQYFRFKQLGRNMVWANAIRGGAARAFGGAPLVQSEQFLAGGGTTLRGFRQDRLTPSPGNALLIVNTEIRRPLFWKIGGVAFFDAGNVYERIGTASVLDLRYSPGFGLRLQTPIVLLRFDLGLNMWPRTGELRKRFSWGIGQAY